MSSTSPTPPPGPTGPAESAEPAGRPRTGAVEPASVAVRAQLLATEHWSLLATRSTTWSEVMSRISIHLTVSSAALVVLALVAQATGFGGPFRVLSIGLTSAVLVLGTLTGMRVMNASQDDAALVLGMNRLRAAYVDLDPGLAGYLTTSVHDDLAGLMGTYAMGIRRSTVSHALASTSMFMDVVNAMVAGTLGALVADAVGGSVPAVVTAGVVTGLGYLAVLLEHARRSFAATPTAARFPSDGGDPPRR